MIILKNNKLINEYKNAGPSKETKEKMLNNILKETAPKKSIMMPVVFAVACVAAAAVCVISITGKQSLPQDDILTETTVITTEAKKPAQIMQIAPSSDAPGMRKFLVYDGNRYAFLENGATYSFEDGELSDKLGTLETDYMANPDENKNIDFATTFALGGTAYSMNSYDSEFRIAVEYDGNYYICENVDTLDNSPVDLKAYFEQADFYNKVSAINIYDHFETVEVNAIPDTDIKAMLEELTNSTETKPSNDEYQQIGEAQNSGKSFIIAFQLTDSTEYKMFYIPSMNIASIGDNKYRTTPEFNDKFGNLFTEQTNTEVPAQ